MATTERRARRELIESARSRGDAPGAAIGESWSRCRPVLDTRTAAAPVDVEPDEVQDRWEASPIRRSGVGLEERLAQVAEAGDLVAAVTDEDGRILWSAGGRTMRLAAERVGFIPGGRWDELSAGTNALGLALLTGRPSSVFSAEHWCESVQDWVCWSVPVRDRTGHCIGVIDLSGRWDTATPVAEITVATLAQLVEEHLPVIPGGDPLVLRLQLLGPPTATFGGHPLSLAPRQMELLAALALEGPCTLEALQVLVYGDRPVGRTTVKAELSHLRQLLGGHISSRPYELTLPVKIDIDAVREHLHGGDLRAATAAYRGSLLPESDAPFAQDHRHVIDVSLRESLLAGGTTSDLLRFAAVHPYDEAILEQAVARTPATDPDHNEAVARLSLARRS
jgi:hypothetical protein